MRQLYFQPKQRQLNLLLCLYIDILQYFQIHFRVYSLFMVWILITHTSWIYCVVIITFPVMVKYSSSAEAEKAANLHSTSKLWSLKFLLQTRNRSVIEPYINSSFADNLDLLWYNKLYSIHNKVNIFYNLILNANLLSQDSKLIHTYLLQGERQPKCGFFFVIALWPFIIYFGNVPTHFPR